MDQRDIPSTSAVPSTSSTPSGSVLPLQSAVPSTSSVPLTPPTSSTPSASVLPLDSAVPSTSSVSSSSATAPRRRSVSNRQWDDDDAETIPEKRIRCNDNIGRGSPISEISYSDSQYSCQGYITEIAFDTPDTDTKSECEESDEDVNIEYEVQSFSDSESIPVINDSSSGADDFLAVAGAVTAVTCEPLIEASSTNGGDSDNSSVAEAPVHRIDYNMCLQCNLRNDNPLFRYCKKCFQVRKTFFPPRPRGFKKKRKRKASPVLKQTDLNSCVSKKSDDTESITSSNLNLVNNIEEVDFNPEKKEKLGSFLLPGTLFEYKEMCILCNVGSKNSIFLHGPIAHMCCCYKCAMKSWKLNKKCPACNRKANNVVKVFEV